MDRWALIQVRVSGVSALREIIGKDTPISLESGSTFGDLFKKLEETYGPAYKERAGEGLEEDLKKRFYLLYNGQIITPTQNLNKTLNNRDKILFFQWTGA